jgi:hypothetical protein
MPAGRCRSAAGVRLIPTNPFLTLPRHRATVGVRSSDASVAWLVASPVNGTGLSFSDKNSKPGLGAILDGQGHARFFTRSASGAETFQAPVSESLEDVGAAASPAGSLLASGRLVDR